MSRHRNLVYLQHMLDHAKEAVTLVQDKSRTELDTDRLLNLSLVRLLEIIGEAANRISSDEQMMYPEVPWQQIVGLRNRLIHGYDSVDFDILWGIVTADLPSLVKTLEEIISSNT
jgi:uncharacterized protein with HEPN domain